MRHALLPMLLVAAAFAFSCTPEVDPLKPENPISAADWHTVSTAGEVIETGDITLDFPSGTFASEERVAVTEVRKGSILGDAEKSPFYQITLPSGGSKKGFTVKIKCPKNPEYYYAIARLPGYCHNSWSTEIVNVVVESSFSDGEIIVKVPTYIDAGEEQPYFTIGLVENYLSDLYDSAGTKADGELFKLSWPVYKTFRTWNDYKDCRKQIMNFLKAEIPKARSGLTGLGFEFPDQVPLYQIEEFGENENAWGYEVTDWLWGKWATYIRINARKMMQLVTSSPMSEDLAGQMRQTLIHETFHYVHDLKYDPRGSTNASFRGALGDEWAMLSDGIACWVEKTTGDKRISENAPINADHLMKCFYPVKGGSYQDSGYAMALFMEWLSKKVTDKKIVRIVQLQHDKTDFLGTTWLGTSSTLHEVLETFLKEQKVDFFSYKGYWQFVQDIINQKVDARVEYARLSQDPVPFKADKKNQLKYDLYNFGISVASGRFGQIALQDKKDWDITFEQKTDGIDTYVYIESKAGLVLIGKTDKGHPVTYSVETLLKDPNPFYMISVIQNPTLSDKPVTYQLDVELEEPDNNVPKIHEVSFDFTFWYTDGSYSDNLCPYETNWKTSYDNDIKVKKDGKGLLVTCDNAKSNYSKDSHATISFHIDKYSANRCEGVSNIVYDYDSGHGSVWHVELDSIPLKECTVDPFNSNYAYWYAKGKDLKVGDFSYELDTTDMYGKPKHVSYKYVNKDSNDVHLNMEYK